MEQPNVARRRVGFVEDPARKTKRDVIQRSLEYGRAIRELEDFGYMEERRKMRSQWRAFSNREIDKSLRPASIDAYYDEYCREPTDEEYKEVECRLKKKYESNS